MTTENLSTLKIYTLTQEQYDRRANAGDIDSTALYLTDDDTLLLNDAKPKDVIANITSTYVSGTGFVYSCDTSFDELWAAHETGQDVVFNVNDICFGKAEFAIGATATDNEVKQALMRWSTGQGVTIYTIKEDNTVTSEIYTYIAKSELQQETGNGAYSVMSQRAVTDALNLKADKATTLEGYGIIDGATKAELDELRESINNNNQTTGNITSENITHAYGDLNILLSNLIENYMLNIDYDSFLSFDTDEIVIETINTSSVLGQAILGQMILVY